MENNKEDKGNADNRQQSSKALFYIDPNPDAPFLINKNKVVITKPERSKVLDRVKAFLPLMEQANKKLEEDMTKNPNAVNIEQVDEDKPYIQMDLGIPTSDEEDDEDFSDEKDEDEEENKSNQTEEKNNNKKSKLIQEVDGRPNNQ